MTEVSVFTRFGKHTLHQKQKWRYTALTSCALSNKYPIPQEIHEKNHKLFLLRGFNHHVLHSERKHSCVQWFLRFADHAVQYSNRSRGGGVDYDMYSNRNLQLTLTFRAPQLLVPAAVYCALHAFYQLDLVTSFSRHDLDGLIRIRMRILYSRRKLCVLQ